MNEQEVRRIVQNILEEVRTETKDRLDSIALEQEHLKVSIVETKEVIGDRENKTWALRDYEQLPASLEPVRSAQLRRIADDLNAFNSELSALRRNVEDLDGHSAVLEEDLEALDMQLAAMRADDKKGK